MPDARLQHTGDDYIVTGRSGAKFVFEDEASATAFIATLDRRRPEPWQAPHLNDAEQLTRRAYLADCDPGDETT